MTTEFAKNQPYVDRTNVHRTLARVLLPGDGYRTTARPTERALASTGSRHVRQHGIAPEGDDILPAYGSNVLPASVVISVTTFGLAVRAAQDALTSGQSNE